MPRNKQRGDVIRARQLRRQMSLPEVMLWNLLRRAPSGVLFRRQHPIGRYILDFYSPASKLAIEVDGEVHNMGDRPQRDESRTNWLKDQGIEVLRIPAKDVLADPDDVADALVRLCADRAKPLHHPAAGPPPHSLGVGGSE